MCATDRYAISSAEVPESTEHVHLLLVAGVTISAPRNVFLSRENWVSVFGRNTGEVPDQWSCNLKSWFHTSWFGAMNSLFWTKTKNQGTLGPTEQRGRFSPSASWKVKIAGQEIGADWMTLEF